MQTHLASAGKCLTGRRDSSVNITNSMSSVLPQFASSCLFFYSTQQIILYDYQRHDLAFGKQAY